MSTARTLTTPWGSICIVANDMAVTNIIFGDTPPHGVELGNTPLLTQATSQLEEYFAGQRRTFSFATSAEGTPFQQRVWRALCEIPYGTTQSYAHIAATIGQPKACRAVGMANNRNPLPIVIPCHRVVGSSGQLTGYAGGLNIKEILLELER